jgi:hypothetical protein
MKDAIFDVSKIVIDNEGRVVISDDELLAIESESGVRAGGDGGTNNTNCSGSSNVDRCSNGGGCSYSTNIEGCANVLSCGGAQNSLGCTNGSNACNVHRDDE